jgi:hypothetical protein
LYSYNTVTEQLTDLTPQPVVDGGGVFGVSDDGSYVYFTAGGALAPATSGQTNIYLYHAGATTFVATVSNISKTRVSANGLFIAFTSTDSLTGYDNTDVTTGQRDPEIYLYSAAANHLSCASCDPAGGLQADGASLLGSQEDGETDYGSTFPLAYDPNSVSDAGQVFFDTQTALLPADSNGMRDVYEYEAGHLHLLSTGTTHDDAWFVNAPPGGSDVFFVTSQQLLPRDGDTSPDLYDARVNGGFPPPPAATVPCVGEGCRPAPGAAPPPPLAASVTFFGPGNASASTATGRARVLTKASGRVRVLTRVVHGSSFLLRVSVPKGGRVTIAGTGIVTVGHSLARAGTYELKVSLTPKWRHALKRRQTLNLKVRVGYRPAGGQLSVATVLLTDKR